MIYRNYEIDNETYEGLTTVLWEGDEICFGDVDDAKLFIDEMMEKEKLFIMAHLNTRGWNFDLEKDGDLCEYDGEYIYYRVGDKDDCTGYVVQVDPRTAQSRHKGNGNGCFWTPWEGGDED